MIEVLEKLSVVIQSCANWIDAQAYAVKWEVWTCAPILVIPLIILLICSLIWVIGYLFHKIDQ